jgi:hypothetical protein
MLGRLLAPSLSLIGLPDDSAVWALAVTGEPCSVPEERQLGEPTKKATRGLRPRMALVSLAVFTGGN